MEADVRCLSDDELRPFLERLAVRDHQLEAELLAHIGEFDARKLYLGLGFPSMHGYCVAALHFSDAVAYFRIAGARAASRFPEILDRVRSGEIHLSGLRLVAPHLTPENHRELLDRARYRSKRQIEEIVADLFPKPAVETVVCKLPTARPPKRRAVLAIERRSPPPEPLGRERYKIQFTADRTLYEKVEELRSLLRHRIPDGDLGQVFELAVGSLLDQVKRKKFAKTERPKARRTKRMSRYVPHEIRREVAERDGEACAFVSPGGRRCGSREFLEYDHVEPWAKHRRHSAAGLRLLCRAHNQHEAVREYGAAHMARFVPGQDLR